MLEKGANTYNSAIRDAKEKNHQDIVDLVNIYKEGKTKIV
jgi:hypothetical protein